jgi:hypothetical protein
MSLLDTLTLVCLAAVTYRQVLAAVRESIELAERFKSSRRNR